MVKYGSAPENLDLAAEAGNIVTRVSIDEAAVPEETPRLYHDPNPNPNFPPKGPPPSTFQYEARITGLAPDTTYYYAVADGESVLAGADSDHFFVTGPLEDDSGPHRFWVVGDSGNGSQAQIDAFQALQDFVESDGKEVDAYLHVGDMAYNSGTDTEFTNHFFNIYRDMLRNTVCWPSMGNHEGGSASGVTGIGPYYDAYVTPTLGQAGGAPSGTEAYYSFDYGPIHFVVLDSHDLDRSPAAAMGTWLRADLEQNNSDWLVAFWHHPPYTKGTHDSDTESQLIEMRQNFMPILEAFGVDLILTGHSHVYERSMLLDGAYQTPSIPDGVILDDGDGDTASDGVYKKASGLNPNDGVVSVVAGHGRSASRFDLHCLNRVSVVEVGSFLFDVEGNRLKGIMLNQNGEVRDEFEILKEGAPQGRVPVAYPWSPEGPDYSDWQLSSGEMQVAISPRPDSPDAVIYYTLDGSEPTTDSPVYVDPITLNAQGQIRAFSVWDGGSKVGPVSISPIYDPRAEGYLEVPLLGGSNDGFETFTGPVSLDASTIVISSKGVAALRFEGINLPADAHVLSAHLEVVQVAEDLGEASWLIEAGPGGEPFLGSDYEFTQRDRAPIFTRHTPNSWWSFGVGLRQATSDLSGLVSSVVQREDWVEGGAMNFFITGDGVQRRFATSERGIHQTPKLVIEYVMDPFELARNAPTDTLVVRGLDATALWARIDILKNASLAGIQYFVEVSSQLTPESWVTVNAQPLISPGTGAYDTAFLRLPQPAEVAGGAFYIRLRMVQQ